MKKRAKPEEFQVVKFCDFEVTFGAKVLDWELSQDDRSESAVCGKTALLIVSMTSSRIHLMAVQGKIPSFVDDGDPYYLYFKADDLRNVRTYLPPFNSEIEALFEQAIQENQTKPYASIIQISKNDQIVKEPKKPIAYKLNGPL